MRRVRKLVGRRSFEVTWQAPAEGVLDPDGGIEGQFRSVGDVSQTVSGSGLRLSDGVLDVIADLMAEVARDEADRSDAVLDRPAA